MKIRTFTYNNTRSQTVFKDRSVQPSPGLNGTSGPKVVTGQRVLTVKEWWFDSPVLLDLRTESRSPRTSHQGRDRRSRLIGPLNNKYRVGGPFFVVHETPTRGIRHEIARDLH